jgi:glycyl-tRNA synthetase (class II)
MSDYATRQKRREGDADPEKMAYHARPGADSAPACPVVAWAELIGMVKLAGYGLRYLDASANLLILYCKQMREQESMKPAIQFLRLLK